MLLLFLIGRIFFLLSLTMCTHVRTGVRLATRLVVVANLCSGCVGRLRDIILRRLRRRCVRTIFLLCISTYIWFVNKLGGLYIGSKCRRRSIIIVITRLVMNKTCGLYIGRKCRRRSIIVVYTFTSFISLPL